ncbi:MAG: hypothetical protein QOH86_1233 [Sphingomonadales bacterium]|jgi:hypothetical protein|nr:hypothetical protein [Sphingomonadales bacterium]
MRRLPKIAIIAAVCLSLGGCMEALSAGLSAVMSGGHGRAAEAPAAVQAASAPLAATTVDENLVDGMWASEKLVRTVVDTMVANHLLVRNTPKALAVRKGGVALKSALNAMTDLTRELNHPITRLSLDEIREKKARFDHEVDEAKRALADINKALGG